MLQRVAVEHEIKEKSRIQSSKLQALIVSTPPAPKSDLAFHPSAATRTYLTYYHSNQAVRTDLFIVTRTNRAPFQNRSDSRHPRTNI